MKMSELAEKLLELSTDPRKHYQLNRFVFAYRTETNHFAEHYSAIRVKNISIYFNNKIVIRFDDLHIDVEGLLYNMGIRDKNLETVLNEANIIDITYQ